MASGTNCGNVARKRWICTRCQGKNGLRYVSPPGCRSLESRPDLNTDTFLQRPPTFFASQRCQTKLILSDNGKTFVGANEELKRCVRSLDNQRIASELFYKEHSLEN